MNKRRHKPIDNAQIINLTTNSEGLTNALWNALRNPNSVLTIQHHAALRENTHATIKWAD